MAAIGLHRSTNDMDALDGRSGSSSLLSTAQTACAGVSVPNHACHHAAAHDDDIGPDVRLRRDIPLGRHALRRPTDKGIACLCNRCPPRADIDARPKA
jgi:hypothetical protein